MRRRTQPEFGTAPHGARVPLCGARTRAGTPCSGAAVRGGSGRCRMHGGNAHLTHGGHMNGRWRGGVSKSARRYRVPEALAAGYKRSLNDAQIGELRDELALTQSLIQRSLTQLESGFDIDTAREAFEIFIVAVPDQREAALDNLRRAIHGAAGNERVVRRLTRLLEGARRLSDSALKRETAATNSMSRADAIAQGVALTEAVTRHVDDPDLMRRIMDDVRRALGHTTALVLH